MSSLSKPYLARTLVAGALLAVAAALPASAAIEGMRFSVRPVPGGSLSEGGDYFVIPAEPGDVVADALEVSNHSARPVGVRLAAVDATTAQLGGVDYTPSDAPARAAGSWIDLSADRVTLAPGEVRRMPFTVSVPSDAPPGVNLGGISVWTPPEKSASDDAEGLAASVEVQTRRVVAVQVELPGPAAPALEIDGVTTIARPDGVYLQVDIRNTGHGFAEGEGTLEMTGESFSSVFPLDKVVPGTGVGYPVRWRDAAPPDGAYPVSVEIDYGGATATFEGEVTVGAEVREELADRGIGGAASARPGWLAPAVGALALAAAAGGAFTWRRRRKPAAAPAPRPPAPPVRAAAVERPAPRCPAPPAGVAPVERPAARRVPPPPPPPAAAAVREGSGAAR